VSDVSARILARMSVSVSVLASWNSSYNQHVRLTPVKVSETAMATSSALVHVLMVGLTRMTHTRQLVMTVIATNSGDTTP